MGLQGPGVLGWGSALKMEALKHVWGARLLVLGNFGVAGFGMHYNVNVCE